MKLTKLPPQPTREGVIRLAVPVGTSDYDLVMEAVTAAQAPRFLIASVVYNSNSALAEVTLVRT